MSFCIRNALLLSEDRSTFSLCPGDIVLEDEVISDVLPPGTLSASDGIDGSGCIILPVLANAHTHAFEHLLKGFKTGRRIDEPHPDWFWKLYEAWPTELALLGARLHLLENLAAGVGVVVDVLRSSMPTAPFEALRKELGLGGLQFGVGGNVDCLDLGSEIHSSFKTRLDILDSRPAPTWIHLHFMETPLRREAAIRHLGRDPGTALRVRAPPHSRWLLSHASAAEIQDLRAFSDLRATVVSTPGAEARLGERTADPRCVLAEGLDLALGSDGPCYNPRLDLFEEARNLSHCEGDALDLKALDAAWRALFWRPGRIPGTIPSLRPGTPGNIVLVRCSTIALQPQFRRPYDNLLDNLLASLDSRCVELTVLAGRVVYFQGAWPDIDADKLVRDAQKRVEQFVSDTIGLQ